MCEKSAGNAGMLFLHENLWNTWSRGLSFVKNMAESVGMRRTKSELCRSQSAMCSTKTGFCLKPKPEYVTEELGMCCCNEENRTKIHVKNVMMVLRGLSYVAFTDSRSTIGSKKVGRAVGEFNVMDSISVVVFDTRLMQEPRLVWRIVVFVVWNANRSVQIGQKVFIDNTLLLAITYQSRSCRERELCGFAHEDDFIIITGEHAQLTWIESRLTEGLNFERCAVLGVDDGVDKTVTILNR